MKMYLGALSCAYARAVASKTNTMNTDIFNFLNIADPPLFILYLIIVSDP